MQEPTEHRSDERAHDPRAEWQDRFDDSATRDAEFETMSGVPLEAV